MTLNEVLRVWLKNHTLDGIKKQTVIRYECCIENYIKDNIGKKEIGSITKADLTEYIEGMRAYIGERTNKELSASSVRCILAVLKLVFAYAADSGIISENPCKRVYAPRLQPLSDKNVFTEKEQAAIERYVLADSHHENYCILLSLYTGVRIGEALALTWGDIDFVDGCMKVTKTAYLNKDDEGHWETVINRVCTKASERVIPLPDFVIEDLRKIQKQSGGDYVFAHKNTGEAVSSKLMRWRFEQILRRLELRVLNFNSLRHTFAVRAIESGMDAFTLSEILGHSTAARTISAYEDSFRFNADAMKRLQRIGE